MFGASILAGMALAQVQADSVAIDAAIKATELKGATEGNFFSAIYTFETKRKQTVYVRRTTDTWLSLKTHEVFSLVYDEKEVPSGEILRKVFEQRFTVGGCVLEAPSATQTNWRIRFRMEYNLALPPARLKEITLVVASTADAVELALYPTREDR